MDEGSTEYNAYPKLRAFSYRKIGEKSIDNKNVRYLSVERFQARFSIQQQFFCPSFTGNPLSKAFVAAQKPGCA